MYFFTDFYWPSINRFGESEESEDSPETGKQLLIATGRQMKNIKQLLLLPITIWSGLQQGFFGADFTAVSVIHNQLPKY